MMIQVVIVEDEMLVRLGMKMSVDEYSPSLKVMEAFASAEEALAYCKANPVDILLTDIRLPGMSGLSLIKELKPICPKLMVVVLSCYEDFSYAREAYELGVDKYLLKHELVDDALPRQLLDMYEKKKVVFQASVKKTIEEKSITEVDKQEIKDGNYKVGSFLLTQKKSGRAVEKFEIQYSMVCEILQELLNKNHLGECYLYHESEIFCVFYFDKETKEEVCVEQIRNFYTNASSNIRNVFDKEVFFAISETFQNLTEVNKNFEITKKQLEYSFYYESGQWLFPMRQGAKEHKKIAVKLYNVLSKEELETYFQYCKEHFILVEKVKEEAVRFVYELSSYFEKSYGLKVDTVFKEGKTPGYIKIEQCTSSKELVELLLEIGNTLHQYLEKGKLKESTIYKICKYLEDNYDKPLNLSEVSDKFHMNTVYFCQYFKKETGVNFVQYLNNIRVEEAKMLLRTTEDTVETIAAKVGVDNPNYFFRLFKKMTGMTVGEYKKQTLIL